MPDSQKTDVAPGLKAGPTRNTVVPDLKVGPTRGTGDLRVGSTASARSRWTIVAVVTLAAFTDILAYSIAVPVLPDLGRRLGASREELVRKIREFRTDVSANGLWAP